MGSRGVINFKDNSRKQLVEGTWLPCNLRRNNKACGTVMFRGEVSIKILVVANFENLWMQCDLLKSGLHHHMCEPNELTQEKDPARRLGIQYEYRHREPARGEREGDYR